MNQNDRQPISSHDNEGWGKTDFNLMASISSGPVLLICTGLSSLLLLWIELALVVIDYDIDLLKLVKFVILFTTRQFVNEYTVIPGIKKKRGENARFKTTVYKNKTCTASSWMNIWNSNVPPDAFNKSNSNTTEIHFLHRSTKHF